MAKLRDRSKTEQEIAEQLCGTLAGGSLVEREQALKMDAVQERIAAYEQEIVAPTG